MNELKDPKTFQNGDAVIIFEDIASKKLIFLEKDRKFENKFGLFLHNDIIGLFPGSKVFIFHLYENISIFL